jgi:RecA-family ATPase
MHIRLVGTEQPTQVSISQALLKDYDQTGDMPMDVDEMIKELEELYTVPVKNIDYSLHEVKAWTQHHAWMEALDTSVSFLQSGHPEKIIPLFQRVQNVGENVRFAGDDFFQTEPRLPDEIIPGVLRAESIGIMSSSSKSYKTWNLLAACIAAAMGKSWMCFDRCTPCRVLYVNLELHEEELKKRVDMVAAAMGTTRAALQGRVDFLNVKGQRNQIDRVLANIRSFQSAEIAWRLIMIDPVYKLYSSENTKENSENSTSAIASMFEKLEILACELGTAIILAHHFRKGNQR